MTADAIWYGRGLAARAVRALLAPASWIVGGVMWGRNRLFDAGVLSQHASALPALSVGNLSVGGTGKTPVAADIARRLCEAGARPAVVLRGYGGDEGAVHARLNPGVPVLTSPDRQAASREAQRRGCDVVVFDDAFQHRWVTRTVDVVLVAAEQWTDPPRLLPAGPYREGATSLGRASLVLVTYKSARAERVAEVAEQVGRHTAASVVRVAFELDAIRRIGEGTESQSIEWLRDRRVLAVAGIGSPALFGEQLRDLGAIVELVSFPDHHEFSPEDVARLVERRGTEREVVCTLKDAGKLAALWPRALSAPWYVSQRISVQSGEREYEAAIRQVLDARPPQATAR